MNRQSMIYLSIVMMVGLMVILISSCTASEVGTPDGEPEEMVADETEEEPGEPDDVSAGWIPGADQVEYRFKPQEYFRELPLTVPCWYGEPETAVGGCLLSSRADRFMSFQD